MRIAFAVVVVGVLEVACRTGAINRLIVIPPSQMAVALVRLLMEGTYNRDISFTLRNLFWAVSIAVGAGFLVGAAIQAIPRVRRIVDPLFSAYYSVPIYAFYPLFIVVFGGGTLPLVAMGAMFGVVAMIMNTMIGLSQVPQVYLKTGQILRLGPIKSLMLIRLPGSAPNILAGIRLAITYSIIGVIAGEFILSERGVGKRISFAYNDFDNSTMYGLMLFVLITSIAINGVLQGCESYIHARWRRS